MLQKIKKNLINNLKNIPGWRTKRKIVIIECDDWGSIRMPSKYVYDNLLKRGLKVPHGWFNLYDTLETEEDLERLFDTLNSVKDNENRSAIMTPVTIVANPDFHKIRSCGFSEYHYEPFTETLKRYYPGKDVFKLWREGIAAGIFIPELHGREHITVQIWMEKLREGVKDLVIAFDNGFTALDIPGVPPLAKEFGTEFYFISEDQKPFLKNSIKDGVSLFTDIFSYSPRVFVPSNAIFHPEFDEIAAGNGIKFLYVNNSMAYPVNGGELKYRHFITGQKGPRGLIYYTRNCAFEPGDSSYKGIGPTLKQIEAAFRWGKPANISTHRANFAGGIDPSNREKGLSELKKLLKSIIQKWPDAEFMSSYDGLESMKNMNLNH
jgi:hypothetical protein